MSFANGQGPSVTIPGIGMFYGRASRPEYRKPIPFSDSRADPAGAREVGRSCPLSDAILQRCLSTRL